MNKWPLILEYYHKSQLVALMEKPHELGEGRCDLSMVVTS